MPHSFEQTLDQSRYLSILSRAPAVAVKRFADDLIPALGSIEVLRNRTGLVMVPMTDSAQGARFFLGEALVAEAHVRLGQVEGYAACLGRDLEQALAIALIDAAIAGGVARAQIGSFILAQAAALEEAERRLAEEVDMTRVEMETF
jgi:alpha-D-ribose 1-methylphosphonate 5-triphosphate synthase subunit PhnG